MTELPTRAAIFENCARSLESASAALADARAWLQSDWTPVGASLTDEAADARMAALGGIREMRGRIDDLRRDLAAAADSFSTSPT